MRVLLVALLAVLPGCAATPPAKTDNVAVVWNRVEEPHQVCEGLSGRKNFFTILGCSHRQEPSTPDGPRVCAIYAPAPRSENDVQRFATLGHELLHCFDGNWHDRWGRMIPPNETASAAAGSSAK